MRKLLIVVFAFAVFLGFVERSLAVDVEPRFEFGTVYSTEDNHPEAEGRKFRIGSGVKITWGEKLKKILDVGYWTRAEPPDDDPEMPSDDFRFSGLISYELDYENAVIYPFAGFGFEQLRRNSPKPAEMFYGDLWFTDVVVGLGLRYKNLYFEPAVVWPFWTKTDSGHQPKGKLGHVLNTGIIVDENINLGMRWGQKRFGGDGSQGRFELEELVFFIGYKLRF